MLTGSTDGIVIRHAILSSSSLPSANSTWNSHSHPTATTISNLRYNPLLLLPDSPSTSPMVPAESACWGLGLHSRPMLLKNRSLLSRTLSRPPDHGNAGSVLDARDAENSSRVSKNASSYTSIILQLLATSNWHASMDRWDRHGAARRDKKKQWANTSQSPVRTRAYIIVEVKR